MTISDFHFTKFDSRKTNPWFSLGVDTLGLMVKHYPDGLATSVQVMKTYHMYHSETLSSENKLKEAERQGERQGRGGEVFSLRNEERHQRRNAARKIQKMKEKVQESGQDLGVYWVGALHCFNHQ